MIILDRRTVPFRNCEFCGKYLEVRPYGPKGEVICFKCAMKDEKAAGKQFEKQLDKLEQNQNN